MLWRKWCHPKYFRNSQCHHLCFFWSHQAALLPCPHSPDPLCQQVFRQGRHTQLHRAGEGLLFLQAVFNRQESEMTWKPPDIKSWTSGTLRTLSELCHHWEKHSATKCRSHSLSLNNMNRCNIKENLSGGWNLSTKGKKNMVIHYQGSRICRHVKFWMGGGKKENSIFKIWQSMANN